MRKKIIILSAIVGILVVAGLAVMLCSKPASEEQSSETLQTAEQEKPQYSDQINMEKWLHNADDHVYYQLEIPYCSTPTDLKYQTLAIFVPEKFLKCEPNEDNITFTCSPNNAARFGEFINHSAPIVLPVETPEYQAMPALSEYKDFSKYTDAGLVYIHAGCRGIEAAAPAAVADLKAAIRYIRRNKNNIPANTDLIYAFGFGEGGGLAAILASSGDSPLYRPYLKEIGAVEFTSDALYGVMLWSPITGIESANEAYEWNMGYTRQDITQNQHEISNRMARSYVDYVNNAGFRNEKNHPLLLQYTDKGIYQSGTYYDHIKSVIETSMTEFLNFNDFPYTPKRKQYVYGQYRDNIKFIEGEINPQGTFLTRRQYLKALNLKRKWADYNFALGYATTRSVQDFIYSFKPAAKEVGAFDALNRQRLENMLFNIGDGKGRHFDELTKNMLKNTSKYQEFIEDFAKQDRLGITVAQRRDMYSPLYFLLPSSAGYRSAKVAPYWRIRSGINQTETPLTTEINLSLAARRFPSVRKVDFKAVWDHKHVMAEDKNKKPKDAFIKWIIYTQITPGI